MEKKKSSRHKSPKKNAIIRLLIVSIILIIAGFIPGFILGRKNLSGKKSSLSTGSCQNYSTYQRLDMLTTAEIPEWIDQQLIPVDGSSRNGVLLGGYNDIVVHYVGNPNTTAQQNHDYYCNPESEVSSHFIIGLDGEIIQCIPLNEMSAASNWRNRDTISIEVCHPDETGRFNEATYSSLIRLLSWLMNNGGLDASHIIRHYDITGKECPVYYVRNEAEWVKLKADASAYEE